MSTHHHGVATAPAWNDAGDTRPPDRVPFAWLAIVAGVALAVYLNSLGGALSVRRAHIDRFDSPSRDAVPGARPTCDQPSR